MELASARYSMGASRVNTVLLNHKHHSAATTVELDYHNGTFISSSISSPKIFLAFIFLQMLKPLFFNEVDHLMSNILGPTIVCGIYHLNSLSMRKGKGHMARVI